MPRLTDILKRARGDVALRQAEQRISDRLELLVARVEQLESTAGRLLAPESAPAAPTARPTEATRAPVSLRTDTAAWREQAQEGELAFHKKPNVRSSDSWDDDTDRKWTQFGFDRDAWDGKLIIDVGAGSRLRTKWFSGARIAAIEPLGERFVSEVEWQDLSEADELYSLPAEQLIPELVDRADLVVSINALDHGYDFEGAIANIRKYLKPGALAFLSFDQHEQPDSMHPLVLNEAITRDVFERVGLDVVRFEESGRYHGGPGLLALSFWLKPST